MRCPDLNPVCTENYEAMSELAYEGWAVIAYAMGGNVGDEWQEAAVRWRDKYHALLIDGSGEA